MVLLVSGWLQADGRPNRHWKPSLVVGLLSDLFTVARLMASRRCQNAPRSPRPRDRGVGREGGKGERRERTGSEGAHVRGLRENRGETELPWNYSAIEIDR